MAAYKRRNEDSFKIKEQPVEGRGEGAAAAVEHSEWGRLVMKLGERELFGETSLSGEHATEEKRQWTIVAEGLAVAALKLTREDFTSLLGGYKELIKVNFTRKVLRTMPLFQQHSADGLMRTIESLAEIEFSEGEVLFRQGAPGDTFYIIKTGGVRVDIADTETGEARKLKDRWPGEYIGEVALLDDSPRMATATATMPTVCMTLDRATFQSLFGDNSSQEILTREAERRKRDSEKARHALIRLEDLSALRVLGTGAYGRVKLVTHAKEHGKPYALKILKKALLIQRDQYDHVENERRLLDMCDHPFLLRLVTTFQDADELYMLLELALGGELFTLLNQSERFDEPQARFYAAGVCSAFAYLHDQSIAYRDLKPENLLFGADGYLKICDFGFAKIIADRSWTICGTPEYLAPEIILSKGHSTAVDWWAFGVLVFEMLVGHAPFRAEDPMEIYQQIVTYSLAPAPSEAALRQCVRFPDHISPTAADLIHRLLAPFPSKRLTSLANSYADSVSAHAFFAPIDFPALLRKEPAAPHVPTIASSTDTSNFESYDDDEGPGEGEDLPPFDAALYPFENF